MDCYRKFGALSKPSLFERRVSEGEAWGSKSIEVVICPLRSASTDKYVANVVLPVLPLCETMDKTFIFPPHCYADISVYRHAVMVTYVNQLVLVLGKEENKVRS